MKSSACRTDVLAEEVRVLEGDLQRGLRQQLDTAAEIGERLEQARTLLPHGEWQPWLKKAGIAKTSAHTYRTIARYRREGRFPTKATTIRQFIAAVKKAKREDEPEDVTDDVIEAGVHLSDAGSFDFGSVDILATDPPWADAGAYEVVGKIGADSLTKDGLLLCQTGNATIGKAITGVTSHGLRHLWTFAIVYPAPRPQVRGGFSNSFTLVVVAGRNRPKKKLFVNDVFHCPKFEKELHPWQQSEAPWLYWLKGLAQRPTIRVCDPYSGSGTIGAVCRELGFGFGFVGTEMNAKHYRTANKRIASVAKDHA